jgi:hypothetical protein
MRLSTRITLKFLLQIGALFFIVWAIIGVAFGFYMASKHTAISSGPANPTVVLQQMPKSTTILGNNVQVNRQVLAEIKQSGGWLQILDSNGNSIYSFNRPHNLPNKYAPGVLVYDKLNPEMFGYQLSTWYSTVDSQTLTWLYGLPLNAPRGGQSPNPGVYIFFLFIATLIATIVSALGSVKKFV